MKEIQKNYCVKILLDPPYISPVRLLWQSVRSPGRTILVARKESAPTRFFGIRTLPMPDADRLLLDALARLSEELEGKQVTLCPMSAFARAFTDRHRDALASDFILGTPAERKDTV